MAGQNGNTDTTTTDVDDETPETEVEDGKEEQGKEGKQDSAKTFEAWLEKQDDEVKGYIEDHTHGLSTALTNERNTRKDLEKKLKNLGKSLEKDSDAKKQLDQISADLKLTNAKNAFYEAAHKAGVTNLRLAWLAADADELIEDDGTVDFEALKENNPQLFASSENKKTQANAHAGEGNGKKKTPELGMNAAIRRAAGRG